MKSSILLGLIALLLIGCGTPNVTRKNAEVVSHQIFDELLKAHVDDQGFVDYTGFIRDSVEFREYLNLLRDNPPAKNWSDADVMAYWINVYNAYTIDIVMRHYPVKSIKDIGPERTIPFVNTVWDIKFIDIGGEKFDLNNIEHGILRKDYDDYRIHFAVNCASYSCPPLRAGAFTGARLEEQLDEQGRAFINDSKRNRITRDKLELSKIFTWYGGDFKTKDRTLKDVIAKYSDQDFDPNAEVEFIEYDWNLNEQ